MNVLIVTIGSAGDVHPFVGIGRGLKQRGHRVVFATNDYFMATVRAAGLEFEALGTAEEFLRLTQHPDLWHRTRAFKSVFAAVSGGLEQTCGLIERVTGDGGEWVVVASSLATLSARILQEQGRIRLVTVHLSPAVIRSVLSPARLPGMPDLRGKPVWIGRMIWWLGDRLAIDPAICGALNALRRSKGLRPIRRPLNGWWNSPTLVLGLWPAWFGPLAADWPGQMRLTGFPLFDESEVYRPDEGLERFLNDGAPPVVFTPGSAMFQGEEFFRTSLEAAGRIGARAVFLTGRREQAPAELPAWAIHAAYVPFSRFLPRCAALVHHGGIGTSAQAMRAGIRQIIVPMAHDQLDNADRLTALGLAREMTSTQYRPGEMALVLGEVLGNSEMRRRCAEVAKWFEDVDPIGDACGAIETVSGRSLKGFKVARGDVGIWSRSY